MYDRKELCKTVKVKDPEMWGNQKTVKVKLFICPEFRGKTDVKIMVESIDDFAMQYTRTCYYSEYIDRMYKLIKENLFDKMPKKISYGWLIEHGYFLSK